MPHVLSQHDYGHRTSNIMTTEEKNIELEAVEQSPSDGPSSTPRTAWFKDGGLRSLYIRIPILYLAATTNGYDGSLLNGLQTMTQWQDYFNHPKSAKIGLYSAILQIGALSAVFFSSYLADFLGRKKGVAVGIIVLIVGIILQVVPGVTEGMFIAGRFLVGLGSNISQGSAPLLIQELAHPAHRGTATTAFNCCWYLGSIIAAWTVFGTQNYNGTAAWKIPVGIQALMPGIQLFGESVVWSLDKTNLQLYGSFPNHQDG